MLDDDDAVWRAVNQRIGKRTPFSVQRLVKKLRSVGDHVDEESVRDSIERLCNEGKVREAKDWEIEDLETGRYVGRGEQLYVLAEEPPM